MFIEAGHGPGLTRADLEGITVDHGHGPIPLEYIKKDGKGYWHLADFSHYGKLDEYDTPTRLFVGDNFEVNTEDGQNLLDAFKNVRDSLLILVSSHESKPDKDGKTVMYSFDPSLIEQPKFKTTPEEFQEFDSTITVLLNEQQKAISSLKKDLKVLIILIYKREYLKSVSLI
jgi:hypothetical protein